MAITFAMNGLAYAGWLARAPAVRDDLHLSAGGFGLAGLAEQVAAVGGALTSGPDGDRWRVEARLPAARPAAVGA